MIESAALAARTQTSQLFQRFHIPENPSLLAEAMSQACDAYNRTATVANPVNLLPHEMLYGEIPYTNLIPFLKPGYCKYKRMKNMNPKARKCFYLCPPIDNPRET